MLIFLIYPFCTLITRSFFSNKTAGFTFENYIRFFTKKYYYSCIGTKPVRIHRDHTVPHFVVGVPIAYLMSRYNVFGKKLHSHFYHHEPDEPAVHRGLQLDHAVWPRRFCDQACLPISASICRVFTASWVLSWYLPLSSSPMCTCTRRGPWEASIPAWRRRQRTWAATSCAGCGPSPCPVVASVHCGRCHHGIHDQPG